MSMLRKPTDGELAAIKNALYYHSGHLYWKDNGNNHHMNPPNARAGYRDMSGGWAVRAGGRDQKAHRVIWYLVMGAWPEKLISHINGNKMDNRIKNLKEETFSERGLRTDFQLDNTLGIHGIRIKKTRSKGVLTYHKPKKFEVRIGLEKGTITKCFTNLADACMWLMLERHRLGFKVNHVQRDHYGKFAPINIKEEAGR